MNYEDFLQSKLFKAIIISIASLIVLAFVFGLGVFVGIKKADFSFEWAKEYHENFAGPQDGFFGPMIHNDFINGNGIIGQIMKLNIPTDQTQKTQIVIEGSDQVEKVILADSHTTIKEGSRNIKLSDLNVSDTVVVIGNPNQDGDIDAKLIRVVHPTMPNNPPANNTPVPNNPQTPNVQNQTQTQ